MNIFDACATRPAPARRVAVCLVALAALLGACRQPPAQTPSAAADSLAAPSGGTLRLATLNAEFLFDGEGSDGRVDFARSGDPQAARAYLRRVARLLARLEADAIMLQEVENANVLRRLARTEPLAGMRYRAHFVQGADHFTGQDVGLLARVPVTQTGRTDERARVGDSGEDYGVSKNLYARLRWQGTPLTLIGVHFLARPDDASREAKREAQAAVIRRLVAREQQAGRVPVVLGDFNDFDAATPDVAAHQPITDVLQTVKRAGPGPGDDLHSVMPRVSQNDRYTAFYDRDADDAVDGPSELSALDHILVGPALMPHLKAVRYVHGHDPARGPDHFPIVATFAPGETTAPPAANTRE
jgi:endonuclease/exonuclease/phosphatase family metal-dependent hydrolase